MKVCLAAQTLSSSVAVAFETLHDLGLSKFQGCLATADFIKRIDRLFDILNSRLVSANSKQSVSQKPEAGEFG